MEHRENPRHAWTKGTVTLFDLTKKLIVHALKFTENWWLIGSLKVRWLICSNIKTQKWPCRKTNSHQQDVLEERTITPREKGESTCASGKRGKEGEAQRCGSCGTLGAAIFSGSPSRDFSWQADTHIQRHSSSPCATHLRRSWGRKKVGRRIGWCTHSSQVRLLINHPRARSLRYNSFSDPLYHALCHSTVEISQTQPSPWSSKIPSLEWFKGTLKFLCQRTR